MTRNQTEPTPPEVFTADEVAEAAGAGVPASEVLRLVASGQIAPVGLSPRSGALRPSNTFLAFDAAVAAVRILAPKAQPAPIGVAGSLLFNAPTFARRPAGLPIAVSGTLHAGIVACVALVASLGLTPEASTRTDLLPDQKTNMRLVFLALPGLGGGGGGGGLRQRRPSPAAERKGTHRISSPMPARKAPEPIIPVEHPEEPKLAVLKSEPLPPIIAPIVVAPGNQHDRIGVLEQTSASADSRGPGEGGGVGDGRGTGLGAGDGSGVGLGSGGGTGGGPYRPGSGMTPPRLLQEVKADYTEDARQRGITGEVVLEIVVRRDGTVGDVRLIKGLPSGLNERAIEAVRQWRFGPARRLGQPVDVTVEVAVEFKLR